MLLPTGEETRRFAYDSPTVTRETRINLWFLGIFLVLSLPGAVILFIKKLDPSASRMDEPDALQTQLPYMAPIPAPPHTRWSVPPKTKRWLEQLTRQKTGNAMASAVVSGPEWEPVISPDHHLQVMSTSTAGGVTNLAMLVWNGVVSDDGRHLTMEMRSNGRELPCKIVAVEWIDIPEDVRHEWVNEGFDHPPKRIVWIAAQAEGGLEAGATARIELTDSGSANFHTATSWTVR